MFHVKHILLQGGITPPWFGRWEERGLRALSEDFEALFHQTTKKVRYDIDMMNFNMSLSARMILRNALS
jgi:hypothetical protein